MPVRSARLGEGNSSPLSSIKTLYTCPAGRTAILKDVRVYVDTPAATRVAVILVSGPTSVTILDQAVAAQGNVSREGFMVLEPGDRIQVYSTGSVAYVWLSGAVLDGVEPT